jgi:formamidopyrimidine-DNA glycosylase
LKRTDIDNDELVKMYNAGTSIPELMAHFKTGHTVIYSHLKMAGTSTNRRAPHSWTPEEEAQLVAARNDGCTGQEYAEWLPNRSLAAIKGHLIKMRRCGRTIR